MKKVAIIIYESENTNFDDESHIMSVLDHQKMEVVDYDIRALHVPYEEALAFNFVCEL